jgi:hypothetical protein
MPVSPEKYGAPSDSISAIPEYNRQNPICHAPTFFTKITISMSGSSASIKSGLHLGASNLFGSYRTTMYVIEPSILLNQCGTPAGMTTTSPVFMCCVTPP